MIMVAQRGNVSHSDQIARELTFTLRFRVVAATLPPARPASKLRAEVGPCIGIIDDRERRPVYRWFDGKKWTDQTRRPSRMTSRRSAQRRRHLRLPPSRPNRAIKKTIDFCGLAEGELPDRQLWSG
jgi:Protein of unknown function (DUF2510)